MGKEILCGFGVDVDAVAGWLGSYGGEDSPDDISRGLFAGEVGSPRLLKLFDRLGIKTTWFIPGHSIETFPTEMTAVAEAGYEIGIHGYSHENPIAMTREQQVAVLDKCINLVTALSGRRPTGYVAPWWEFSNVTNELLLERGIKYDHSLMHHDHQPYYVRVGDSWTKIDYSKQPAEWMVPLRRGRETDLIEIPRAGISTTSRRCCLSRSRRTAMASSIHATSSRCGATSSTGSTANMITPCSRSPFIPTYPADRMC